MSRQVQLTTNRKLNILAYYQIIGGAVGLAQLVYLIAQTGNITGLLLLIFSLMIVLYGFSIYCGRLLAKKDIERGLKLSKINQAIQMVYFSVGGYGFKFISGVGALVYLDLSDSLKFGFNMTPSTFLMNINSDPDLFTFGINILAIFLVHQINELQESLEEERLLNESYNSVESLGE